MKTFYDIGDGLRYYNKRVAIAMAKIDAKRKRETIDVYSSEHGTIATVAPNGQVKEVRNGRL